MFQADGLTILLFLVGLALAFSVSLLVWAKRAGAHTSHALNWLEGVFVAFVGVVAFIGWVGVLLASFGHFSMMAVTAVLLLASGVLLVWQRPLPRPTFTPLTRPDWLLLLLLPLFTLLYFRPHEYILGGADAGGYMNIATTLAQTGDFIIHDEWMPLLREYADLTLRQQPPQWQTRYLQFVGWYIDDQEPTRLIPQFFPLHPVLLALGVGVGGLTGGLLVTPLWGVLSLLAVYLLTRQLFDAYIGLLAAFLLGITPTHIFFARYPTTEPLTLLLVFAMLFAWQRLWDDHPADPIWGIFGGLLLGAANLTRIDLPLVVLVVALFCGLRWWLGGWSRAWTWFVLTAVLLLLHAAISAVWLNWPYTWNTYGSVLRLLSRSGVVTAVLVLALLGAGVVIVAWWRGWLQGKHWQRLSHSTTLRWLLVVAVVGLSLFTYFGRPILQPIQSYTTWPGGQSVPVLDGENWVRLGWYLTPLGLALATGGLAWIILRRFEMRLGLFLSVGVLTTIQYVYRIFNTPYHIYTMRRYVPVVIPVLIIFTAVALLAIFRYRGRPWASRLAPLAGAALTLVLVAGLLFQSRYVLPRSDFTGAVAQLTAFHQLLEPDALIIISEPPESTFADWVGTPLRFLWGHDVATIRSDNPELADFLQAMVDYAAERGRPLQLLAVDPIPTAVRQNLTLQPVTMFPLRLDMLQNSFTDFPSVRQNVYLGIEVYDVLPAVTLAAPDAPALTIDVGTLDAAYIDSGFYYKEPLPGAETMRWTQAEAVMEIPAERGEVHVTVRAKIYRPEDVVPTAVIVWLDGRKIGQFTPDDKWQTYTFTSQSTPTNGLSRLRFVSETFNPAALGVNDDGRDLGFLLDWVKIEHGKR
jgi:4-amino-4-deoxy-L-arabinose transferase-like glycosyltransferase